MPRRVDTDILGRPIIFDYPDRLVPPAAWVGHIPFAFWMVDALRPKVLVELGTHSGNSYSAFTQAVQRVGLDTRCFAVDTWRGDAHSGFYGEDVFDEFRRYHDTRYQDFSQLVRATFDDAVKRFEPGSIDLLHIDGLHTYEAAKHDFETWLGAMSSRGVVLLHDVNVRDSQFGVWKLWDELSIRYPHFMFTHSNGLGVLGVGPDIEPPLRGLFDHARALAAGRDDGSVRAAFERLGAGLVDRVTFLEREEQGRAVVHTLTNERDQLVRHGETVQRENAARGEHIGELERAIRTLQAERDAIAQQVDAVHRESVARGRQIADLEKALRAQQVPPSEGGETAPSAPSAKPAASAPAVVPSAPPPARPDAGAPPAAALQVQALFDAAWYVARNPDVAGSGLEPWAHYLQVGAARGASPNPLFDPQWYLQRNPDVAAAKMDPVVHYLEFGAAEGRDPHPLFDTAWYLERSPRAARSAQSPLMHYLQHGMAEGSDPNESFDRAWYLEHYPDVAALGTNPFLHYVQYGAAEGREPHARATPGAPLAGPASPMPAVDPAPRRASIGAIHSLQEDIVALRQMLAYQTQRIDHALGLGEGVLNLSEDLRRARMSPAFQEPFERSMPLVSVCIATCNRAPILIDRCIRSLQAQTYPNLQIVVVGDHCTDDTGYRLAQLGDHRIVFENLPQRGPYPPSGKARWQVAGSNAMNRALDLAEGDFIAHLDDDDEATFDRIESLVAHVQAEKVEFCWHSFWYEAPDGTWARLGNGDFTLGQITTGSTFYHRHYARIKWSVDAFRLDEPGDWNRFRKIKLLQPKMAYFEKPLTFHFKEMNQGPFVAQFGETFLQ